MNKNILSSYLAIVVGLAYGAGALMLRTAPVGAPNGPKILPLLLATACVLTGIVLWVRELAAVRAGRGAGSVRFEYTMTTKMTLICTTAGFAYGFLLEHIGYILATILFLLVVAFTINGKKYWKVNLIVPVVFSVVVYFIFNHLLDIVLPPLPFMEG